ncbi:hypothetical protein ROZALSC1DRAFT_20424 [Rozella allomycis CSF55]|uniref:Uncharacterized protein n=1 Tax=Rozella allomycis (strain CSF55) TaxID=988480 RepID=A0A4P9YPA5_ROZAC|nr:hypothetical protein ROZALSC1DRAFT_20424 [Rozella allomycis CSF55]
MSSSDIESLIECSSLSIPPWPSLFATVNLECYQHIWPFITIWGIVFSMCFYFIGGMRAYWTFRKWIYSIFIMPLFVVVGASVAFMTSMPIGIVIGLLYEAGRFKMAPWVAMIWGLLLSLFMVLGSMTSTTSFL